MIKAQEVLSVEVNASGELSIKLPDGFPYEDLVLRDALEALAGLVRSVAAAAGLVSRNAVRLTHGGKHQGLPTRRAGTG